MLVWAAGLLAFCRSAIGDPDGALHAARQAVENDCHIIGVSSLAAGHLTLVPELHDALADFDRAEMLIVVGGVVPPRDVDELLEAGATAVYPPGTVIPEAASSLLADLCKALGYDDLLV